MRHVRQSSFVHKRSVHFGFQANISVLGCLNHTTLTCPSAETERADSDVTSFFRMATSISSTECACHMLRSSRVSGWRCLMWNRSLSVRVSACVRKQTLALFSFPRSERNGDCGWCLIIQVRVKRWLSLVSYCPGQDETMMAVGLFSLYRSEWYNDCSWPVFIFQVRMK